MASSRSKNQTSGVVRTARRTHSGSYIDDSPFPTSRAPPTRAKSGCWTCRLRRKKCDENRRSDGTCDTCKRLRLQCLGWGAKRPEWCRDKEKVEQYKLEIKQQVSFHGSVRPNVVGDGASTSNNARAMTPNNSSTNNAQLYPNTNHLRNAASYSENFDIHPVFIPNSDALDTPVGDYFGFSNLSGFNLGTSVDSHGVPSHSGDMDPLGALLSMYSLPLQQQHSSQIWSNQTTPDLNLTANSSPLVNPITSAIDQSMANISMHPPAGLPSVWDGASYAAFGYLPSLYGSGSLVSSSADPVTAASDSLPPIGSHPHLTSSDSITFGVTADVIPSIQPPQAKQPQIDPEVVRKQIFYYFNRVRKMQYCLAGESTKDVLRDLVVANPYGVVTNAICALASIHHICMLRSIGQETEDPESTTSLPRRFYAQANEQIMASKIKNGSYTALDATAALQLVSFSLFVGGIRGWENALQIAGDWFEKTGVLQHENPLRAMWELNVTAKFASRLVVWFDIFSSITLQKPARFLSTYRRMLRQNDEGVASQKFWRKDLNMQATMGCPDAVLLSIAEIADLAAWKDQEKKQGSLSYRELNLRADTIEQELRACKEELELEEARAVLASSSGVQNGTAPFFGNGFTNAATTTTAAAGANTGMSTSAPGTPSSTSGESVSSFVHKTPSGTGPISLPLSFSDSGIAQTQGQSGAGSPTADLFSAFPGAPASATIVEGRFMSQGGQVH
ncbi:hypothetical protein M408DRAFT_9264 [Serendipita vermifera MAFF 305830]|uniref:Zn(2)-C6 fungal-type domain-containing protein n=1 Tax=Serendipita vermifera MAFF 305830 TaxID=933852 RepID=A0A0C3ASN8_SERVB|nr:hypothetical protein M408DRAFT_9264 [Serendipita vermifera MAFF 305830]